MKMTLAAMKMLNTGHHLQSERRRLTRVHTHATFSFSFFYPFCSSFFFFFFFVSSSYLSLTGTEEAEEQPEGAKKDNPLPGFIDPITLDEVEQPAISPSGHVMSYSSWSRCLTGTNICPLTKQPLKKRDLVILTWENIGMVLFYSFFILFLLFMWLILSSSRSIH